jgi:hypothetical protein
MNTYGGTSIFRLNLRYTMAQIRMINMGNMYGLDDRRVIAQSHLVDKYHTQLERLYRAEREASYD